jgi:hypothetical protein
LRSGTDEEKTHIDNLIGEIQVADDRDEVETTPHGIYAVMLFCD